MRFAEPASLVLLSLVPALAALFWMAAGARRRDAGRFAEAALFRRYAAVVPTGRRVAKTSLFLAGLLLAVLALARPQLGTGVEWVRRSGIDLAVTLDTSYSMMAEDVAPSRLEAAKIEVKRLLGELTGDRVTLVVFAGKGYLQCPLTSDYRAASFFLDMVRPGMVPDPGTNLADALDATVQALSKAKGTSRVAILMTDGEALEGDAGEAAERAAEARVKVYAVGFGSEKGEPIPIRSGDRGVVDYKKDDKGEVVLTRLDEETLKTIAEKTGGRYFRAGPGGRSVRAILSEIAGLEKSDDEAKLVTTYEDRFQWLLAPALLLLALEMAWPLAGWRREGRWKWKR